MSASPESASGLAGPPATPQTTALPLGTFADLHRQEAAAEQDIFRTLPFFGTALGIGIAALIYAAGRLPKWPDLTTDRGLDIFAAAGVLLTLAIFEAICVPVCLSRALTRRPYQRIGPGPALRARLDELQAFYQRQGVAASRQDGELVEDMRQVLLESYVAVRPVNRAFNQRRYKLRARAAQHLIRSLIRAGGTTIVIFVSDKLGYLPKVIP